MLNNLNSNALPVSHQTLDLDFEGQLLASRLVSEIRKRPGHYSFTLTDEGMMSLFKAMKNLELEEEASKKNNNISRQSLFPKENEDMISKKEVMLGFGVSHTTLWKWEKRGYLVPVRLGKCIFYKREDIEKLTK